MRKPTLLLGLLMLSAGAGAQNVSFNFDWIPIPGTGINNTGFGWNVLAANTTGNHNTATGNFTLQSNNTGMYNAAHGMNAMAFNSTGNFNSAHGSTALYLNTTGNNNTATGFQAMRQNSAGSENAAHGFEALLNNTTGSHNTADGYQALQTNTTGSLNTALGFMADAGFSGLSNASAIGANAMVMASDNMILGDNRVNVGIGLSGIGGGPGNKLEINFSTAGNFATPNTCGGTGYSGLRFTDLTSASVPCVNPGTGVLTVDNNGDVILVQGPPAAGFGNLCVMPQNPLTGSYEMPLAGLDYNFTTPALTPGHVTIGQSFCSNPTARLTVIDDNIGTGIHGEANYLMGNPATVGVLGNITNGNSMGRFAGVAGFVTTPNLGLLPPGRAIGVYGSSVGGFPSDLAGYFDGTTEFNGDANPAVDGVYTLGIPTQRWLELWAVNGTIQTSDARTKENVKELAYGLNEIMQLQPVSYNFIAQKELGNKIGFLAQDLKKVVPEVVREGDDENKTLGVNYGEITALLVKGMQEQQKEIEELRSLVLALSANGLNNNGQSVELGDKNVIVLDQNVPNPFAESTVITYSIPTDFAKAQIHFSTAEGKLIRSVEVTAKGAGRLQVYASDLSSGVYFYSLVVDGKVIETKKMVKE